MRLTRRDIAVAAVAAGAAWSVAALAQGAPAILGPTATLEELEIHVTTLNPGIASHPPHHHPNEEIVIVRTGTVEVLTGGVWKRLGPGSIIFNASNSEHALKNVGTTPATYDVINWKTPATPAS